MADVATVAEENIVGVHVVKSFAQEQDEGRKFADRSESVFDQSLKANKQRALYVPLLSFLPLVAQAVVLLVGGRMVVNGDLSLRAFIFFNVLVVMLVDGVGLNVRLDGPAANHGFIALSGRSFVDLPGAPGDDDLEPP
jgi:ATP-binding cassette subfamily B protein